MILLYGSMPTRTGCLIDDELERRRRGIEASFLDDERRRQIGFAEVRRRLAEHADVEPHVERHFGLATAAIGFELLRRNRHRHAVAAVVGRLHLRVGDAQIPQRDLVEQRGDERLFVGRRFCSERIDQIARHRERRALERIPVEDLAQRAIHRVFADRVLERVHREAAFAVVHVRLILDQPQRQFLDQFAAAILQIVVEFVLQESTHLRRTVLVLHDHQRRVLRQRLDEQSSSPCARRPTIWCPHHWCASSCAVT